MEIEARYRVRQQDLIIFGKKIVTLQQLYIPSFFKTQVFYFFNLPSFPQEETKRRNSSRTFGERKLGKKGFSYKN